MGYADDRPVFLGLGAFPDASTANWVQFLRGGAITGRPVRVLTDDGIRPKPEHRSATASSPGHRAAFEGL
jgi:hypothetical protein